MQNLTEQFVAALEQLHQSRDVDPLVDLFADDATPKKAAMPQVEYGKVGARTFWQHYRDVFDSVDATFRHVVNHDEVTFVEWKSTGTLRDGAEFQYEGISVLERQGNEIGAFRTYYDASSFIAGELR